MIFWSLSTTCSRPPTWNAAVASTLPFSTTPKLGCAAADVDIEDALSFVVRHPRRAGAVGRQHRFHVMARSGGDEFAALLRQHSGDGFGILAPQRLAGQDHDAGIDVVGMDFRGVIGVVDDGAELGFVDALFAGIGRQRDRRLKQGFARDDVIAAGEIFAEAAQIDAGEDDLRSGRADVDADRVERDVVLDPERVVLQPLILIDPVVIVIGIALMLMHEVLAVEWSATVCPVGFFGSSVGIGLPLAHDPAKWKPVRR